MKNNLDIIMLKTRKALLIGRVKGNQNICKSKIDKEIEGNKKKK